MGVYVLAASLCLLSSHPTHTHPKPTQAPTYPQPPPKQDPGARGVTPSLSRTRCPLLPLSFYALDKAAVSILDASCCSWRWLSPGQRPRGHSEARASPGPGDVCPLPTTEAGPTQPDHGCCVLIGSSDTDLAYGWLVCVECGSVFKQGFWLWGEKKKIYIFGFKKKKTQSLLPQEWTAHPTKDRGQLFIFLL